jgi:hypothetical protein
VRSRRSASPDAIANRFAPRFVVMTAETMRPQHVALYGVRRFD